MRVAFYGVGRDRDTWECDVPSQCFEHMEAAVAKRGCLISRDIDFSWDTDGVSGYVCAGSRVVGTFRFLEKAGAK